MSIKIDREKCVGCGMCAQVCEEVFELGEDGKAQVKKNANLKAKCVEDAIGSCGVSAISTEK